ncbi:tRNA uridine-5-carboxymethylaminomethyl(34) synthesis enzyme MnmG [Sphingomonas sp. RHCKR47]|uniref:tRNA uridine-5-carboxymethylaminomethyl(34) synthesis enzyme MnmG n=1 Tax=Sphingomonas citricola TaxID=2862498 RepID=UPI001CA59ED2|nr:tRNA uridine-5-carboxymethylaminomethyl(34) synthesis enzyme MnmG [Sphingomonas citricola]MBW6524228.1 tRNA uridine-5-carboxymethylaminomethyl(34) synthesis enzyme MnmG [Sphingomonas citricola]
MFHVKHDFDVVVVGGGHAGTEAAAAAARRGARVALLTQRPERVGAMSCNPSIGGLGKGHLVREVDAFDGLMARASDAAAIHHRMLNRSKGLAVQGPRIQADRGRYLAAVQELLRAYPNLVVMAGEAAELVIERSRVGGVVTTTGQVIHARAVVLATGTFLGGRLFRGSERHEGGRVDEAPANRLGEQLRGEGLPIARLKTGTPPRLDGRTIDWARLEPQPSDADAWTMSPMTAARALPQVACAITRTTVETHDIIRGGLDDSPLFGGAIEGQGPRYCPSIEDKVHRFGDRDGHQIFLEPEALDDATVYPNGISTSLATDVQEAMVRSISGLERARITTPGYAVEYDHVDPRALDHHLHLSAIPGVFCAGQINGTTGYEEAAAQGLVAGLNAAAHACDLAAVKLDRADSYIGVMIDDLVLQGVSEPYRMLTARAEFRLSLRADNAETRLSPLAIAIECVTPARRAHITARDEQRARVRAGLADGAPADIVREIEEDQRYAPYLARQADEIERMRRDEGIALPPLSTLNDVPGLSNEMIERLTTAAPRTLAEASRVRGVTPAALSTLWLHARKLQKQHA